MARYAILNTVEWEGCRALAAGQLREEEVMQRLSGCAWLFRVEDGTGEVEEAARSAVREFFSGEEGRHLLEREQLEALTWAEAILWMPDEVWKRHGLQPIRHPDVERIILDADEDLAAGAEEAVGENLPGRR
ncbi:hypothetical protein BH23GEM7_BH23GEM7_25940 [soil metagenome]|jgi:hypothetical protein